MQPLHDKQLSSHVTLFFHHVHSPTATSIPLINPPSHLPFNHILHNHYPNQFSNMTDIHQTYNPQHQQYGGGGRQFGGGGGSHYGQHQQHQASPRAHQAVKAATAATAGGSLLILSGLTLAGTVIALTVATPLLVIFSPVLVPAAITVFLLATGFLTSGGFGVAAVTVLSWIYRYATGGHPPGSDTLDEARDKLGYKAREMKGRAEQATGMGGHHQTGGIGHHQRADM